MVLCSFCLFFLFVDVLRAIMLCNEFLFSFTFYHTPTLTFVHRSSKGLGVLVLFNLFIRMVLNVLSNLSYCGLNTKVLNITFSNKYIILEIFQLLGYVFLCFKLFVKFNDYFLLAQILIYFSLYCLCSIIIVSLINFIKTNSFINFSSIFVLSRLSSSGITPTSANEQIISNDINQTSISHIDNSLINKNNLIDSVNVRAVEANTNVTNTVNAGVNTALEVYNNKLQINTTINIDASRRERK